MKTLGEGGGGLARMDESPLIIYSSGGDQQIQGTSQDYKLGLREWKEERRVSQSKSKS